MTAQSGRRRERSGTSSSIRHSSSDVEFLTQTLVTDICIPALVPTVFFLRTLLNMSQIWLRCALPAPIVPSSCFRSAAIHHGCRRIGRKSKTRPRPQNVHDCTGMQRGRDDSNTTRTDRLATSPAWTYMYIYTYAQALFLQYLCAICAPSLWWWWSTYVLYKLKIIFPKKGTHGRV